jgi:hypothetical protein
MYNNEVPMKSKMVISMYLDTSNTKYTFGAIRNAQLMKVYFPGWKLRVYIPSIINSSEIIPDQVINKLTLLKADVFTVGPFINLPHWALKYYVIDDVKVTHFIVRNSATRITDRLSNITQQYFKSGGFSFIVRDTYPGVINYSLCPTLFGKSSPLKRYLGVDSFIDFLVKFVTKNQSEKEFIKYILLPKLGNNVLIYDSYNLSGKCISYLPGGIEFNKAPTEILYDQNEIPLLEN